MTFSVVSWPGRGDGEKGRISVRSATIKAHPNMLGTECQYRNF